MLPRILDIAKEHNLIFDQRSFGKKETLAKCPFCEADAHKPKKYYLSLNTDDQVYRCWYCRKAGGVLDFEARLTNKSFKEVRQKYFGKKSKKKEKYNPAEYLTAEQLEAIGWNEIRRKDYKRFKRSLNQVCQDWFNYERWNFVQLYAEFVVIAYLNEIGLNEKQQQEWLVYLIRKGKSRFIDLPLTYMIEEFIKEEDELSSWAKEGLEIARTSWKICQQKNDFSNVLTNIPFIQLLMKELKNNEKAKQVAN